MENQGLHRKIKNVWKGKTTMEGAGVRLKRVFGFSEVPRLDPFLMMDSFHSNDPRDYEPGFPWHPHRGIETITYVLQGEVEHGDSMGNRGLVTPGGVQWMTAGSGIIHQEMPRGNDKREMWGFQFWANLPARDKMMDPRYREIRKEEIPEAKLDGGVTARVISGGIGGARGPVAEIVTEPEFFDISIPAGKTFTHALPEDHTAFAYILEGEGYFDTGRDPYAHEAIGENYFDIKRPCVCTEEMLVLYGPGPSVHIAADKKDVRFLFLSGKPLREPIAWYGPVVMNTQEELRTAFAEYEDGTFVKHSK